MTTLTADDRTSPLLISNASTWSTNVEAYRMLRTIVSQANREDGARTFLVTSAGRGEGKSVTSANLALSLADMEQQRVLLLDCDLRRPSLAKLFGIPPSKVSLLDIVGEDGCFSPALFQDAIVEIVPNLHVFAASTATVNQPAEFLESQRMRTLLDTIRDRYDVVVIDSPPAGVVTDATVLGAQVDAVLFVLGYAQTSRRFVRRTLRELRRADANVLGVIVNRSPRQRRHGLATAALGGEYYTPHH